MRSVCVCVCVHVRVRARTCARVCRRRACARRTNMSDIGSKLCRRALGRREPAHPPAGARATRATMCSTGLLRAASPAPLYAACIAEAVGPLLKDRFVMGVLRVELLDLRQAALILRVVVLQVVELSMPALDAKHVNGTKRQPIVGVVWIRTRIVRVHFHASARCAFVGRRDDCGAEHVNGLRFGRLGGQFHHRGCAQVRLSLVLFVRELTDLSRLHEYLFVVFANFFHNKLLN